MAHYHVLYIIEDSIGAFATVVDLLDEVSDEEVDAILPTAAYALAKIHMHLVHSDNSHYMIYTPSDPLLFVARKDQDGFLQIADDDLLDDPAILNAIDEETEFNALVEEEAALLESLMGKE